MECLLERDNLYKTCMIDYLRKHIVAVRLTHPNDDALKLPESIVALADHHPRMIVPPKDIINAIEIVAKRLGNTICATEKKLHSHLLQCRDKLYTSYLNIVDFAVRLGIDASSIKRWVPLELDKDGIENDDDDDEITEEYNILFSIGDEIQIGNVTMQIKDVLRMRGELNTIRDELRDVQAKNEELQKKLYELNTYVNNMFTNVNIRNLLTTGKVIDDSEFENNLREFLYKVFKEVAIILHEYRNIPIESSSVFVDMLAMRMRYR